MFLNFRQTTQNLILWLCLLLFVGAGIAPPFAVAQESDDHDEHEHADGKDTITLQLKWLHNAQFAGYYVAQELGYYEEENLRVELLELDPTTQPALILAVGGADVAIEWMPPSLSAREDGIDLVNIAQPFNQSAFLLSCFRDSGIVTLENLAGKNIGVWHGYHASPFKALLSRIGIRNSDDDSALAATSPEQVAHLVPYSRVVQAMKQRKVDCAMGLSYIDPLLYEKEGIDQSELIQFNFNTLGLSLLEDGLWVLEDRLEDPKFKDAMARFVRASMRGWHEALDNPEDALEMVAQYVGGNVDLDAEKFTLDAVLKLVNTQNAELNLRDYERTVEILLGQDDEGVLSRQPKDAWTADVTDAAAIYELSRVQQIVLALQSWGEAFVKAMLDPVSLASHLYNGLIMVSMMMRNVVALRIVFLVALLVGAGNDLFWRQDSANLFWTLLIIAVNIVHLLFTKITDLFISFKNQESEFVATCFESLPKFRARKIIKKGEWGVAEKGMLLSQARHPSTHLYYIMGGSCSIKEGDEVLWKLHAPLFHGQLAIVDVTPALWTAEADEGMVYWRIAAADLRALMDEDEAVRACFDHNFLENLKKYIDAMQSNIVQNHAAATATPRPKQTT